MACRDYPHSRHLCLKFPFHTTPHESYCELVMKLLTLGLPLLICVKLFNNNENFSNFCVCSVIVMFAIWLHHATCGMNLEKQLIAMLQSILLIGSRGGSP